MEELVFMRHGHALSRSEAGVAADSERPLSPFGESEALEAARHLRDSGFTPDRIVSSPFLRAARTADIASQVFPGAARETSPALSEGPAEAVVRLVEHLRSEKSRVLIVGHQPLMGAIAGYFSGRESFDLSPAGFVRVAGLKREPRAELVEFYSPPARKR